MEEFLRYLILNLIGTADGVELTQSRVSNKVVFQLKLPASEVGKIIGKQGHAIDAIRNLLSLAAARHGQKATLQIVEG